MLEAAEIVSTSEAVVTLVEILVPVFLVAVLFAVITKKR